MALGFLVSVVVLVVGWTLLNGRVGFQHEAGRITSVQDFASHTRYARTVWHGEFRDGSPSLYTVEAHLRFMREWTGKTAAHALPFGYSPTMLWILGPLSALPLSIAYILWSLLGLGAAVYVVLHRQMQPLVALMVVLSPVAIAGVALGQTAILSMAGLLFLMDRSRRDREGDPPGRQVGWLAAAAVLWALGGKPPLALVAVAALLGLRDHRPVIAGFALTAITTWILTPWIGLSWPADYLTLISKYDRTQADPAFAWSFAPALMANLRALLSVDAGVSDALASRVSNLAWAGALVGVTWTGRTRRITPGGVWALAVLSYLLLCPHVTFTENLLLLLVPPAVAPWTGDRDARRVLAAWLLVPLGLVLSPAIGPAAGVRPTPLFFIELVLLVWVLHATVRPRPPAPALALGATTPRPPGKRAG